MASSNTQHTLTLINGVLSADLSVADRGFSYGDGVFETMLFEQGDIALWLYHYQRMVSGLKCLQISLKASFLEQHMQATLDAIEQFMQSTQGVGRGILKLMISRGEGGRGYSPSADMTPTIVSIYTPLAESMNTQYHHYVSNGIKVHYCHTRLPTSHTFAGIKSLNALPYVLASRERLGSDWQEGLVFSEDDRLIEATARNLFIIKQGELYTPSLESCGVLGVMRRLLIDIIAPQLGIQLHEISLNKKNLLLADEVIVSNSITALWPVIECESIRWPVGSITQRLQRQVNDFIINDKRLALTSNPIT